MSTISLVNVDALVENKDMTLDETLNIVPSSSKSVYFDDKDVSIYPYDNQLKKIIRDDMPKDVPMANGQREMKATDDNGKYQGEGFLRVDTEKRNRRLIYAGIALFALNRIFR